MTKPAIVRAIRRKLNAGAALVTPFRFARLFHDGDLLWLRDDTEKWRRLTKAIRIERDLVNRGHWSADVNRLVGLHQARVWLRRNRQTMERAA